MAPEEKQKFKSAAEREQEAYESAHTPLNKQFNSAELAEAEGTNPLAGPVLAPEASLRRRDPNLDPNVKNSVVSSTAGPARTETTRAVAREAGLVNEAGPDSPRTTLNSQGTFGETLEQKRERVREANAERGSAPNTTPNAAEQDEDGKTKPEVVDAIEEANAKIEADEKAKADAQKSAGEKAKAKANTNT
jgi:hypothetical protein